VPFRRVIESEWEVCSAGTVEYRGSVAEEDTPRKPGTEHRKGATIGRRKATTRHLVIDLLGGPPVVATARGELAKLR
jgi:hypothetical protein